LPFFFNTKKISAPTGLFNRRIYLFLKLDIIYLRNIASSSRFKLYKFKYGNFTLFFRLIACSAFGYINNKFTFFSEKILLYLFRYPGKTGFITALLNYIIGIFNARRYITYVLAPFRIFYINILIFINLILSSKFINK
jgi:hypothetical protein